MAGGSDASARQAHSLITPRADANGQAADGFGKALQDTRRWLQQEPCGTLRNTLDQAQQPIVLPTINGQLDHTCTACGQSEVNVELQGLLSWHSSSMERLGIRQPMAFWWKLEQGIFATAFAIEDLYRLYCVADAHKRTNFCVS